HCLVLESLPCDLEKSRQGRRGVVSPRDDARFEPLARFAELDGDHSGRQLGRDRLRDERDDVNVCKNTQLPARMERFLTDRWLEADMAAETDQRVVETWRELTREEDEPLV